MRHPPRRNLLPPPFRRRKTAVTGGKELSAVVVASESVLLCCGLDLLHSERKICSSTLEDSVSAPDSDADMAAAP